MCSSAASFLRQFGWGIGVALLLGVGPATAAQSEPPTARGLQPLVEKARGGECVAEPAFMRRNHMKLLRHQRDDTLRGGIRTGRYSLKACVACHASPVSQSVTAEPTNFCQSCHTYAAVKVDCFECHANTPDSKMPQPTASAPNPVIATDLVPLTTQPVKP